MYEPPVYIVYVYGNRADRKIGYCCFHVVFQCYPKMDFFVGIFGIYANVIASFPYIACLNGKGIVICIKFQFIDKFLVDYNNLLAMTMMIKCIENKHFFISPPIFTQFPSETHQTHTHSTRWEQPKQLILI